MHLPTMFAMIMMASAVMAASIAIVAHHKHADLQAWAWGLGAQLGGYGFMVMRPLMPEWLSIIAGNGLLSMSLALYTLGLYRFSGLTPNRYALHLPLWLMLGINLVFLGDVNARSVLHSALYGWQACFMLVLLRRLHGESQMRGSLLLGIGIGLFVLVMAFRLVALTVGGMTVLAYNESTLLQVPTFLISLTSTMMLAVGILMMTQERAEQQLALSEAHYRQLVETATNGICIVQAGTVRYANPRMHQLFGYAPDSLRGTPIQNLVSAEDWPLVLRNHQLRLAGQGDDLKYPARMHTRHAGIRWFEVSGVRIQWQNKEATLNYLDDITQRREMEETVQGLAYLDPLTKLPNRRLLMDRLGQAQLSTLRNGTWAAVVFLDLDRFKLLNDIHGHHAGDLLLKEVAQRLVNCVRAIDTVARLGGDEFVVLLTDLGSNSATAQQAAQQVSQKMLAALAQPYQLILDGSCDQMEIEHECSASAGLVLFAGTTPPVETLLEQADAAMYAAKKAGRNQLSFHTVDSQPAHV